MSVSGRNARRRAGELEGEVLASLHAASDPLTPREVQEALGGDLAYTTVLTILSRLYAKGLVQRLPEGRGHAYCPTQTAAQQVAQQMHDLLELGIDRAAILAQFVDGLPAPEEQLLLSRLLEQRDRQAEG